MNLIGKKTILRAIEEKDQELLLQMVNDPEIEKMIGGYSFPVSYKNQLEWFNKIRNDSNNIRLMVETIDGETVGFANILNIDWKNRVAFHGIKLANHSNRSKGIGTDVVMTVMKYCFEELNLNRLEGSIVEYNIPSKNLYVNKLGWKIEGILRKSIFKNNQYHDNLAVAILKDEYLEVSEKLNYWD